MCVTRGTYVCTKKICMANRGVVWADAEVRVLIGFWGDSRIQAELDGAVRNKAIHEKIAMKMAEAGCPTAIIASRKRSRCCCQ